MDRGLQAGADRDHSIHPIRMTGREQEAQIAAKRRAHDGVEPGIRRWSSSRTCDSTMSLIRRTGKLEPQGLPVAGVDRSRAGRTVASPQIVRAKHAITPGIDRLARPNEAVPPSDVIFLGPARTRVPGTSRLIPEACWLPVMAWKRRMTLVRSSFILPVSLIGERETIERFPHSEK